MAGGYLNKIISRLFPTKMKLVREMGRWVLNSRRLGAYEYSENFAWFRYNVRSCFPAPALDILGGGFYIGQCRFGARHPYALDK